MAPRRGLLLAGLGVALTLASLLASRAERLLALTLVTPATLPSHALLPPTDVQPDERQTEAEVSTDLASARRIDCETYAGPLRWRNHPGGKGARSRKLPAPGSTDHTRLRPVALRLRKFDASSLRLLPGSVFAAASETNKAYLRMLEQDRLFFSFRATAGLPQPRGARPYGGWEAPGAGIRGHFVGHYLTALATGAASGDDSLLTLARSALRVLEECQRAHTSAGRVGYLSAFAEREFDKVETLCASGCSAWVPHYATQKVLSGLLALHHEVCRLEPIQHTSVEATYQLADADFDSCSCLFSPSLM